MSHMSYRCAGCSMDVVMMPSAASLVLPSSHGVPDRLVVFALSCSSEEGPADGLLHEMAQQSVGQGFLFVLPLILSFYD